jgi:glycosyltransferase involved in cell wall biosynthesis
MGFNGGSVGVYGSTRALAQFGGPDHTGRSEAAEIAGALALKLGCPKVGLIGCLRAPILRALSPPLDVVGIDTGPIVAQAREFEPRGAWWLLAGADELLEPEAQSALRDSLLVVNAHLVMSGGLMAELRQLMAEAPAAVVIDPDGGLEMESLAPLVQRAEEAGLTVEHRSLVRSPEPGDPGRRSPLVVLGGSDPRVGSVLAAGPRGLALDPHVDLEAKLGRPLRVCIASYEVAGPTRNGGIGTANTSLALALARAGHEVTLLLTGYPGSEGLVDARRWERHYSRQDVQFQILGTGFESTVRAPHANVRRAYEFYRWLREREANDGFDIVHFPECQGHAYYAVLGRHQRIAFDSTLFVAGVHSSTRWCSEANRELPRSIDALVDERLERVSVELADVVISPSAYMLDYLEERGWKLPDRRFVQQYILPPTARPRPGVAPRRRQAPIEEVVFFGRLEVRKGIETFCDALDRVAVAGATRELRITFLGRPENVLGEPAVEYIARRSRRWPWPYEVLGKLDQQQAMTHLRRRACLAVMPSTVDNSPNTVSEALSLRIPVITSRSGGTGELIDPLDLPEVTFRGLEADQGVPPVPAEQAAPGMSAAELADRMLSALSSPVIPGFAIDHDTNERVHVAWNVGAAAAVRADRRAAAVVAEIPSLTVGVLHRGDGDALIETLTALAEQRDELLDVVVVDDDSPTDLGQRKVSWAEEFCHPRGWMVIRRVNRHAGAAREQMIANGRGGLFVFLRSTESLAPGALASVRDVARRTGADVLSWPTADPHLHYGEGVAVSDGGPLSTLPRRSVVVPISGPALVGLRYPAFSTGPYAITRAALDRLHGFAPDARGIEADHDLLNRAVLEGCTVEVIPEPLTTALEADPWASVRRAYTIETGDYPLDHEQALRIARPFALLAPRQLADLPGLQLTLLAKTAGERMRAIAAYEELDNTRHTQAEYIAYLESEHELLSDRIHELEHQAAKSLPRRLLGPVKRRVLG